MVITMARRWRAAVERALRALQHFDLLDVDQVLVELGGLGLGHAVDHHHRHRGLAVARLGDAADDDERGAGVLGLHVTFGVDWMKSRGRSTPLFSKSRAVKAVTWAGTFCSVSSRARAVTITSPTSVAVAAPAGVTGWAWARVAPAPRAIALAAANRRSLAMSVVFMWTVPQDYFFTV